MKLTKLFTTLKHINNNSERISLLLLDFQDASKVPPFVNHSLSLPHARTHSPITYFLKKEKGELFIWFLFKEIRMECEFSAEFSFIPIAINNIYIRFFYV